MTAEVQNAMAAWRQKTNINAKVQGQKFFKQLR